MNHKPILHSAPAQFGFLRGLMLLYQAPSKDPHTWVLLSVATLLKFFIIFEDLLCFYYFNYVYTCISVCGYMHMIAGVHGSQEASDPMEGEMVLWKSNKCWAISPAPQILNKLISDSALCLWSQWGSRARGGRRARGVAFSSCSHDTVLLTSSASAENWSTATFCLA